MAKQRHVEPHNKPSLEEMQNALKRSGYLLESRLESIMNSRGFFVEANSVYPDPHTGKSRELDLLGVTLVAIDKPSTDRLWVSLVIECMNNAQPVVFITKKSENPFSYMDSIKLVGVPPTIEVAGSTQMLYDMLKLEAFHHYCGSRIATQYCSFTSLTRQGKADWIAIHDENHHDALSKLCAATEYNVINHYKTWDHINARIFYPIVVLQGELFETHAEDSSGTLFQSQHVQYQKYEIVGKEIKIYRIDVVTETFFPNFLTMLREEVTRIALRAHENLDSIRDAVAKSKPSLAGPPPLKPFSLLGL